MKVNGNNSNGNGINNCSFAFSKSRKGGGGYANGNGAKVADANGIILSAESAAYVSASSYPDGGSGGYFLNANGRFEKTKGLNWFVTGLFVVGDLAGGGLVALPTAMIRFGFLTGFFCTFLMSAIVCYTAYVLGHNWLIMQRLWPQVFAAGHCRKPYPDMAERAMGKKMRTFVSICINLTQFGIAVVYLLLSSKNIHDFLRGFLNIDISFCYIILIVALALLPITFLRSPQDFWGVVVLAMFTTALAVILILIGASLDYGTCAAHLSEPPFTFKNYFLALGTFIFSFGGHAVFPTIQHDMQKPFEFTKSSILAFSIIAALYIPVCVLGYVVYGDSLRDSIINSLQSIWIQQSVNMLITIHCILTLTIVFNPINQETEERMNVPHHFCLKRVLVRSGTMFAVVFVAETMPSFGPLLDLVGGSTLTLTSLVFPALFYLYLRAAESKVDEAAALRRSEKTANGKAAADATATLKTIDAVIVGDHERSSLVDILERTDKTTLIVCTFIIAFGVIGGCASTFSALQIMSYTKFVPPCYVTPFLADGAAALDGQNATMNAAENHGVTNCCGHYQNITRLGAEYCAEPDFKVYA